MFENKVRAYPGVDHQALDKLENIRLGVLLNLLMGLISLSISPWQALPVL